MAPPIRFHTAGFLPANLYPSLRQSQDKCEIIVHEFDQLSDTL